MPLDTIVKLALAPLLLAQGLTVRKRALVLPEPPGPRDGVIGDGAPLRLLILGDSSAAGVGAPSQADALSGQLVARLAPQRRVTWRLIARAGATTAGTLTCIETEPPASFDLAVVAIGVNDATRAVPLKTWLDRQARLCALITARFGVAHVILTGLPPMGAFPALPQPLRWVMGRSAARLDAGLARQVADDPDITHLRFAIRLEPRLMATDGFHPGPKGYALWAETLAAAILRLEPPDTER